MEAAQARLSLHLSKYHIFGNHVSRLNYIKARLSVIVIGILRINIIAFIAAAKISDSTVVTKELRALRGFFCPFPYDAKNAFHQFLLLSLLDQ